MFIDESAGGVLISHEKQSERTDLLHIPVGKKMFEIEKAIILATLEKFRYNRTKTAKSLGIGIRTLQRRLKDYDFNELGSPT